MIWIALVNGHAGVMKLDNLLSLVASMLLRAT
jgi:hypothetical protein